MDNTRGYYDKYKVTRSDGKPVGSTIVIEIDKDPQASEIMLALAKVWESTRPTLASDLLRSASAPHDGQPFVEVSVWEEVEIGEDLTYWLSRQPFFTPVMTMRVAEDKTIPYVMTRYLEPGGKVVTSLEYGNVETPWSEVVHYTNLSKSRAHNGKKYMLNLGHIGVLCLEGKELHDAENMEFLCRSIKESLMSSVSGRVLHHQCEDVIAAGVTTRAQIIAALETTVASLKATEERVASTVASLKATEERVASVQAIKAEMEG